MNDGLLGFPKGAQEPSGLLGFPLGLGDIGTPRHTTYNQEPAQTYFNDIAAPVSANTKNTTWETIVSDTAHDTDVALIAFNNLSTQSSFLVDVAWCGAGQPDSSLTVVLENLCIAGNGGAGGGTGLHPVGLTLLPMQIPAGSRIAARTQCSSGSQSFRMPITICGGGFYSMISQYLRERMCSYVGVNLAASRGTQVDPGGSAGAKGTWTELGRLEKPMKAMVVCVNQENAAASTAHFRLDISRGTDREVILPDYYCGTAVGTSNSGEGLQGEGLSPLLFVDLQAGDTLAARLQSSITDATDRILHVSVVGFS